jgi:hypothetical protein
MRLQHPVNVADIVCIPAGFGQVIGICVNLLDLHDRLYKGDIPGNKQNRNGFMGLSNVVIDLHPGFFSRKYIVQTDKIIPICFKQP